MIPYNFPSLVVKSGVDLSSYDDRQKIELIEWVMLQSMENIADEIPVTESVKDGWYTREIRIPEGICLTGKIHTEEHICILSQGDLSVMTDHGIKRIKAPYSFKASAGIKKIGYAHQNCVFTTLHRTKLKTLPDINKHLFIDSDLTWVEKEFKGILCQPSQSQSQPQP